VVIVGGQAPVRTGTEGWRAAKRAVSCAGTTRHAHAFYR
jgi:hypothetical protein